MTKIKQTVDFSKLRPVQSHQRGLVLIVTLLALMILLLASVALIRSTDTNLQIAGNMAFKRDAMNQAERAIPDIQKLFTTGALKDRAAREANLANKNYFATIQKSNASGIPEELFKITSSNANNIKDDTNKIEVRYVIDRMCLATGEVTEEKCSLGSTNVTDFQPVDKEEGEYFPVYRISVRAIGPKNTEAYMQATFSD